MAAWEACSAMWNLDTNSAFALGRRKTMQTLIELAGLFFSFFFVFQQAVFYNYCYVHMIWMSTKLCTTYMEGINAYVNKYAYKYTYISVSMIL
jgi:hypothetical protein